MKRSWIPFLVVAAASITANADSITVAYTYNSLEAYVGEPMGPEYLVYTVPDPPVRGQDYWLTHLLECDAELIIETTTKTLTYDPEFQWIEVYMTVNRQWPDSKYIAAFTEYFKWAYEPGDDPMNGDWVNMGLSSKTEGTVDMYWYEYDVRVVPERSTALLVALGLVGITAGRRCAARSAAAAC